MTSRSALRWLVGQNPRMKYSTRCVMWRVRVHGQWLVSLKPLRFSHSLREAALMPYQIAKQHADTLGGMPVFAARDD